MGDFLFLWRKWQHLGQRLTLFFDFDIQYLNLLDRLRDFHWPGNGKDEVRRADGRFHKRIQRLGDEQAQRNIWKKSDKTRKLDGLHWLTVDICWGCLRYHWSAGFWAPFLVCSRWSPLPVLAPCYQRRVRNSMVEHRTPHVLPWVDISTQQTIFGSHWCRLVRVFIFLLVWNMSWLQDSSWLMWWLVPVFWSRLLPGSLLTSPTSALGRWKHPRNR